MHDLEVLLDQCLTLTPDPDALRADAQKLNVFAVEVRYPGFEAKREDAAEALQSMEKLVGAIKKYFESLTHY